MISSAIDGGRPAMDMVVLGRVTGPYSLQGWVRVHLFGDDSAALGEMSTWWLGCDAESGPWSPFALEQTKPHGKGLIAKFRQVDGRNAAEGVDGFYIAAPRDALPKISANEYYWADLKGLSVKNAQGDVLGQVTELMTCGAHDVLCVRDDAGHERLLPFVAQVIRQVDAVRREILVEWGVDW